jgi:hypothetical protein
LESPNGLHTIQKGWLFQGKPFPIKYYKLINEVDNFVLRLGLYHLVFYVLITFVQKLQSIIMSFKAS